MKNALSNSAFEFLCKVFASGFIAFLFLLFAMLFSVFTGKPTSTEFMVIVSSIIFAFVFGTISRDCEAD